MAREIKEVAHLNTNLKNLHENWDRIDWNINKENVVVAEKCEDDEMRERLDIAIEALEFILTFKGLTYLNCPRGSVFEVSREALKKIRGEK